jgi:micrococcal nuclease
MRRLSAAGLGLALWLAVAAACAAAAGEWATVQHVNDGDTLTLADGRLVRIIGIDAPEIDHASRTAEPLGMEAHRRSAELVRSRRVRLEFDQERSDPHGRVLAHVWTEQGELVSRVLVREGLAVAYHKAPNLRYGRELLEDQRAAMSARRGIWEAARGEAGAVIGNANSRRFHRPECPEAKRIRPRNRIRFENRWEAFWQGYSPSRECHPPAFGGR